MGSPIRSFLDLKLSILMQALHLTQTRAHAPRECHVHGTFREISTTNVIFPCFIACRHLILFDDDNFNQMLDERYRMSLWLKLYTLEKNFFSIAF